MRFKRIDLGQVGVPHVVERLSHPMSLSRFILETVDLSAGRTYTFFPHDAEISREELLGFSLDSDELGPVESADHLESVLHRFLAEDQRRLCIFEDIFLKKGDSSLKGTELPVFFYNSEVYYFLSSPESTLSDLEQLTLASQSGPDTVYVVTRAENASPIRRGHDVTTADLEGWAEHVEVVVVEAYDGGGYVVWLSEQGATFGAEVST